jgi:CotS family spore coat protein
VEDINYKVFKEFGVKPFSLTKERFSYICSTDKGIKIIKKNAYKKDNIIFQHEVKEYLYNAGLCNTDRFIVSLKGLPFVNLDDNLYTMTELINYRQTNFYDKDDLYKVTKALAKMHKKATYVPFSGKIFYQDNPLASIEKNIADINNIKKRILLQKKLSDFDVFFIKNYDFYKNALENCLNNDYIHTYHDIIKNTKNTNSIIHNLIKEENFMHHNNLVYYTGFSRCKVGYHIIDLCSLIKRYIKKAPNTSCEVYNILNIYSKYNSLNKYDIGILCILLKHPLNFLKVSGLYYSKKRTWAPSSFVNKMEALEGTRYIYQNYIVELEKLLR